MRPAFVPTLAARDARANLEGLLPELILLSFRPLKKFYSQSFNNEKLKKKEGVLFGKNYHNFYKN
jgi:hypothetical protein